MFGVAVARLEQVGEAERRRYQALYCGLCLALKERYGQVSRAALSYDLAFLVMLYGSLYEPGERTGETHCITHPRKKVPYAVTPFSEYCAGLSVALAYHKCLDDVADDRSVRAGVAQAALRRAYGKVKADIPEHCEVVACAMRAIGAVERDPNAGPDEASVAFGEMLGFLFECVPGRFPDLWSGHLRDFGFWLGRFIYLMDAAVDFREDAKSGSYNPFVRLAAGGAAAGPLGVGADAGRPGADGAAGPDPEAMRDVLAVLAGRACEVFERMPLVQDANLMRSVLYSGVWQKFNQTYEDAG